MLGGAERYDHRARPDGAARLQEHCDVARHIGEEDRRRAAERVVVGLREHQIGVVARREPHDVACRASAMRTQRCARASPSARSAWARWASCAVAGAELLPCHRTRDHERAGGRGACERHGELEQRIGTIEREREDQDGSARAGVVRGDDR